MNVNTSENTPDIPFLIRQEQAIIQIALGVSLIDTMNKENFLKKVLNLNELPIKNYPRSRQWMMKIPAAIRKEGGIGIPVAVYGKDRDTVINKLFEIFIKRDTCKGGKITLTDLFEEFITEREADPDFARHTSRKNRSDWNTFFKDTPLARAPVGMITPADLMEHYKHMTAGRKMTKQAFGNAKGVINQLFDLAYEKNLVDRNISRGLSTKKLKFRPGKPKGDMVYTAEERLQIVEELKNSENVYDKAIIAQFCLTCRIGEIKGLYWSDLDFKRKEVYIHRELVDDDGIIKINDYTKNELSDGNRVLPMTPRLEAVFNSIPKPENKDSYIFVKDYKPIRTQTVDDHLRSVCRKLDIRYLSSHKIRSWGITESLATGMDQATVMKIAGHASPQTMRHYVRTARIQKDITQKYADVFN